MFTILYWFKVDLNIRILEIFFRLLFSPYQFLSEQLIEGNDFYILTREKQISKLKFESEKGRSDFKFTNY